MNIAKTFASLKIRRAAVAVALSLSLGCSLGAGSAGAAGKEGLDSLDDRTLGAELSGRGYASLLDHYFKSNRVPESDQRAIKTVGALSELRTNPNITYADKLRRVREVSEGIDAVIPTVKDPNVLMATAGLILEFGVKSDVNNLEYWGEDPTTRHQLKPQSQALVKLLDAASAMAKQQAEVLSNQLNGGNNAVADKWEKMDNLSNQAAYMKNMSVYFDAIATEPKDATRATMCVDAAKELANFDTPDSGIQPRIKVMLGKLAMAAGDQPAAKKHFSALIDGASKITPPPTPFEQYDARYFTAVSDVLAGDVGAATADKASLDGWVAGPFQDALKPLNLDKAALDANAKGIGATSDLLQYRILTLAGEKAKTPAEKKKQDDAGEAVLLNLRKAHPEFAARIDMALVNRRPLDKKIDDSDPPSVLTALLKKGMDESFKANADMNVAIVNRGVDAANAIINRKDRTGFSPTAAIEASLSIALLQDRLDKKVDAVNSYLDYAVNQYKLEPKRATESLDRAGYLVFEMKKLPAPPIGFEATYARFLPIAIEAPFNHKDLAYMYAEQLRLQKKYADALKYYRMILPSNPLFKAASFKIMVVLDAMLDGKLSDLEHKQAVGDLRKAAEQVKTAYAGSTETSDRNRSVQAVLVLADLARTEDKDPKKTLKELEGFENVVKGLPNENDLMRMCNNTRVNAMIGSGQAKEAVELLTKLLVNAKGGEGIGQVRALLDQLDKEFRAASVNHDMGSMREIAKNEAMLTHYFVDYTNPATQKNAELSKYYYAYMAYDAKTQRVAGSLADDPAEKKKLLDKAADQYKLLQGKEMHDLYIKTPTVAKRIEAKELDAAEPDPEVAVGQALTAFDLGDYKTAYDQFYVLIANKRLGMPQHEALDDKTGEVKVVDNEMYWDAYSKFMRSGAESFKNDPSHLQVVVKNLKNMLILGGIPELHKEELEDLRKKLCPDFDPNAVATTKPAGGKPAATAPTAAVAPKK